MKAVVDATTRKGIMSSMKNLVGTKAKFIIRFQYVAGISKIVLGILRINDREYTPNFLIPYFDHCIMCSIS